MASDSISTHNQCLVRKLLSTHWRKIKSMDSELIPILLKKCCDRIYVQANQILDHELGDTWAGWTYEEIRSYETYYGYTSVYLYLSANFDQFSSLAKIPIILELAKLDLQKGATISELIFSCCLFFPVRKALRKLLQLGNQNEHFFAGVLEFHDNKGFNPLICLSNMATQYTNATKKYPSSSMVQGIEESFLAKSNNLDLVKILNQTTKDGETLFYKASFSESITWFLLRENVKVNSVNDVFQTPNFRVRVEVSF